MDRNTTSSPSLQVVVVGFKPFEKNTLRGFVTIELPQVGLVLHECPFHRGDSGAWVGLPARSYEQNGQKKWMRLVDTISKEAHYRFQTVAVRAVEEYLAKPPRAVIPK